MRAVGSCRQCDLVLFCGAKITPNLGVKTGLLDPVDDVLVVAIGQSMYNYVQHMASLVQVLCTICTYINESCINIYNRHISVQCLRGKRTETQKWTDVLPNCIWGEQHLHV